MCIMLHIRRAGRARGFSRPEWALIGITALWGATFLIVHRAMATSGPWFFIGVRFLSAGLFSAVLFRRRLHGVTWVEIGAGASIGAAIYLGYGLQTAGLQTVSPSESAFVTAFYVPLVPLLQLIVLRKPPSRGAVFGVLLAFAGLLLLAGPGAATIGLRPGEVMTLLSTIPIAGEVILISLFTGTVRLAQVTVVQLLTAGLLGLATMPVVHEGVPRLSWAWALPGVGLGLASAVIQLTMNWAQRSVTPTRATAIYAGEPVWGGLIGALAGDRLPASALIGGALVVAGVLVSELPFRRRSVRPPAINAPATAP